MPRYVIRLRPERPADARPSLTHTLRFELAGEDERPLLGSSLFAVAAGVSWLGLVAFGPQPPPRLPPVEVTPVVI
jgi:hypothetical protein